MSDAGAYYRRGIEDTLALVEAHRVQWLDAEGRLRALGRYDEALYKSQGLKALELLKLDITAVLCGPNVRPPDLG